MAGMTQVEQAAESIHDTVVRLGLKTQQEDWEKADKLVWYAVGRDWEHNGRDDSDWYQVGYNPDNNKITRWEIGSTRYGGGVKNLPELPPEHVEGAKRALYVEWCKALARSHFNAVEYPSEATLAGRRVELKKRCSNRATKWEPCRQCNGTGQWVNPKREGDVRQCFGCSGTKQRKVKNPGGPMQHREVGLQGTVMRVFENRSQYGTFNYGSRAEIRTDDGDVFVAPLANIRLVLEAPTNLLQAAKMVDKIAKQHADSFNAYPLYATSHLSSFGLVMVVV